MKILGLQIENYGALAGFSLGEKELTPGLCLIYGLNETGKSTLLSFIRAVLFGFKTEGKLALPVSGGHPAGSLLLESEGVVHRVRRHGPGTGRVTVESAGAAAGGEEVLRNRILRGVSPVLFRNIFAFGVDELRRLETLTDQEVNVYIYGAGTGANPLRLAEAAAELDKRAGALFNPRGRVQIVNRLLRELAELERRIRGLEQQPRRHGELRQEIAALEEQQTNIRERMLGEQQRADMLEKLIKGRAPWQRRQTILARLRQQERITGFPQEGLARLETLLIRRDEKKEQWRDLKSKVQDLQSRRAAITVDEKILQAGALIEELEEQRALYGDKREALAARLAELQQGDWELKEKITVLGPNWNEDRVLAVDSSLTARSRVEEFARAFQEQEQKNQAAAHLVKQSRLKQEHWQGEQDYLTRQFARDGSASPPGADPEVMLALLEQAAAELERGEHLREMHRHKTDRLVDMGQQADRIRELSGGASPGKGSWFLFLLPPLFLTAAWFIWQGRLDWLGGGAGLAFTAVMSLIWFRLKRKKRKQVLHWQEELAPLEAAGRSLTQELAQLTAAMNKLGDNVRRAAQTLTGGESLTMDEIPRLKRLWKQKSDRQRQMDELKQQLERVQHNCHLAHVALTGAQQEEEICHQAGEKLRQKWRDWLKHRDLPELSPAAVLEFLTQAEQVQGVSGRLRQQRLRAAEMAAALDDYESRVWQLTKNLGRDHPSRENTAACAAQLYRELREQQGLAANRRALSRALAEAEAAWQAAEQNLARREEVLALLLTAGGSRDEEEFRRRAVLDQEQTDLRRQAQGFREQLLILAGSDEEYALLVEELGCTTEQEHQEEYRLRQSAQHKNLTALDEVQEALAARRQEIMALENGIELAQARQEREMLRENLAAAARQWQIAAVSGALLGMAREKHERERQPAVLDAASRWFALMTQGRYSRVVAPVGRTAQLEVEEPGGRRLTAACLSRGAAGQLYLSLRLALARHFSGLVTPLPLILDDPLVDFDPPRLRGALRVLDQVASDLQVILLTCHQHLWQACREESLDFAWSELGNRKKDAVSGQGEIITCGWA